MVGRGCLIAAVLTVGLTPITSAQEIVREKYAPGVVIRGTPAFVAQTRRALKRLRKTPTGRALMRALARRGRMGRTATITQEHGEDGWATFTKDSTHTPKGGPGRGGDSTIGWNPTWDPEGVPPEVILGHELIHALHSMQGRTDTRVLRNSRHPDFNTRYLELKTVGIRGFRSTRLTENRIRRDWNRIFGTKLPMRKHYARLYGPRARRKERDVEPELIDPLVGRHKHGRICRCFSGKKRGARGALEGM